MSVTYTDILTTQTFQNWLDRTNSLSENFGKTATLGDAETNTGNLLITGDIKSTGIESIDANPIIAKDSIKMTTDLDGTVEVLNMQFATETGGTETPTWTLTPTDVVGEYHNNFILRKGVQDHFIVTPTGATIFDGAVAQTVIHTGNISTNIGDLATNTDLALKYDKAGGDITGNVTVRQAGLVVTDDNSLTFGGGSSTENGISLNPNGNMFATGDITAFGSFSDVTLKENLEQIESALYKVTQLTGYTFNYIESGRRATGVIAQDLEQVLPEAVYETEHDHRDVKAVRYGNMMGLVVEAIKELNDKIEELKRAQ